MIIFVSAPEGTYPRGVRDVFRVTMKEEGIFALYKGVTPVMLRAFPANAVSTPPETKNFSSAQEII